VDTFFRIHTSEVEFELQGPEAFVREQMERFLPDPDGGTDGGEAPAEAAPLSSLRGWYEQKVPKGRSPTMQDSILIFAYFMKRVKDKHLFSPGDIKGSFSEVGRSVPKSLLQIMGTLRRDHRLLWSPEGKRGVYALTPKGIKLVEQLLGIQSVGDEPPPPPPVRTAAAAATAGDGDRPPPDRWQGLFRDGETDTEGEG